MEKTTSRETLLIFLIRYIWGDKKVKFRCDGNVACMGKGEIHIGFWWGNLTERRHLEDVGVDGWIILKFIFRNLDVRDGPN